MNYGALSTTVKSLFEFDKIYANRQDVINSQTSDGVLVGRFILISYSYKKQEISSIQSTENSLEIYRLSNLAADNGINSQQFEDIVKNCDNNINLIYKEIVESNPDSYVDYDSSIWVKTSNNNYQLVLNSKLATNVSERLLGQQLREETLKSYADSMGAIAESLSYQVVNKNKLTELWNRYFTFSDFSVEDRLEEVEHILYTYTPLRGSYIRDDGFVDIETTELSITKVENSENHWQLKQTFGPTEGQPTYTEMGYFPENENGKEYSEEYKDNFIYLMQNVDDVSKCVLKGTIIKTSSELATENSKRTQTIIFKSDILNNLYPNDNTVLIWYGYMIIQKPESPTNNSYIDEEEIKNLWYTGQED